MNSSAVRAREQSINLYIYSPCEPFNEEHYQFLFWEGVNSLILKVDSSLIKYLWGLAGTAGLGRVFIFYLTLRNIYGHIVAYVRQLFMGEFLKSIEIFSDSSGKLPFESWFKSIKDKRSKAKILQGIDRLRLGNFGDCKSVGSGVYELRIHFGPGFRVYFGLKGESIVLLLCGGDKSTQKKDIDAAHRYWKEYKDNEK